MHEEIFRALDDGASIITATHRLARVLTGEFHAREIARGHSVWGRPDILPLDAFLERQWRSWLLNGVRDGCPRLLDAAQEQVIWEQIILDSPEGETLLQISETARTAMAAWKLIHSYRLPVDGRFEGTDDGSAFRKWSASFRERCEANRWLERARLCDFLTECVAAGEVPDVKTVRLAGFDQVTPQQAAWFEVLEARHIRDAGNFKAPIERRKAADKTREIWAAAEWARRILEQQPDARIGIVVPELKQLRLKVERIFRRELETSDYERLFHVSLGPSLGDEPLVLAAQLMLEFGRDSLALPKAGVLLRSPFLGGAEVESGARALLDAKLRKRGMWNVTLADLNAAAGSCPLLQRVLGRLDKERKKMPERQSATEWSRSFARLLKALGWPGDRPLTSREHQLLKAWGELLSQFAALDLALRPLNFAQALARLREMAAHTPFQVENEGAPVQILGLLEAAGLQFDHLWIMGLDDATLPAAANPNPFLPLALQREYKLPHSSPEQELEFARGRMTRLLGSARHIVISYSELAGDRPLAPSPLVAAGPWQVAEDRTIFTDWIAEARTSLEMESLEDATAPPVQSDGTQSGGASLFKDMAACPFRAFAKHRLHAKPLEDPVPGLGYSDRGSSVHKALELIWRELKSHARLMDLRPDELRELVARHAGSAVNDLGLGAAQEKKRLERLLVEWLELEKLRDPFTVRETEYKCLASISGLQVQTRADRVDQLDDGRELIIDYKTGNLGAGPWRGDRPDEPQLPLYCVTNAATVAGAAFAVIRTGELGFRGLTAADVSLPSFDREKASNFEEELERWKQVLEALAEDFQAGLAEVDPKPKACDNCGLTALCRIEDYKSDRG